MTWSKGAMSLFIFSFQIQMFLLMRDETTKDLKKSRNKTLPPEPLKDLSS
jgi:hypothetical protein